MRARLKWFFIAVFFSYAALRIFTNLPAAQNPRELNDTISYLRISQERISFNFFNTARPFVFPLFLKISGQDVAAAASLHVILSILAWVALAWTLSASLRTIWLKPVSFGIILALSLVRHLAGWDYVMLTESLSVTFFVAFLAAGIWLLQKWHPYKVILLSVLGFLLAFTRDTNAYLLLMLAGMLGLAVLFKWGERRLLILSVVFIGIFLLNNTSSDLGKRWVFPLNNVIGRRILPFADSVSALQACGMPVNKALLGLANSYANSEDRAFYNDPDLEAYRGWLLKSGKICYMKFLLSTPVENTRIMLNEFQSLIIFDKLGNFFARKYDPVIPYFIEPFLYPAVFIIPLWLFLTLAALYAAYKKYWQRNPLWGVFVLLCLSILPHLFITWHGDAMAPERHALSVGLQLALSAWLFLFLILDGHPEHKAKRLTKPNILHRFIHTIGATKPVNSFFAPRLHRLDKFVLKLTKDKYTVSEFIGWNIIQLTTKGAKSGEMRVMPLIASFDGGKIILIASSFGREHNPGWYYNLKANPRCQVTFHGKTEEFTARETDGDEREKCWNIALESYRGYDAYKERASHRKIPVMLLEK